MSEPLTYDEQTVEHLRMIRSYVGFGVLLLLVVAVLVALVVFGVVSLSTEVEL